VDKLEKNDYSQATLLFEGVTNSKPVIFSVLENNVAGEVYVDDAVKPQTALVVLLDMLFLAGNSNTEVCEDISNLLENKIFTGKEWGYWDFYCMNDQLRVGMERVMGPKIEGYPTRLTFALDHEVFDSFRNWRERIPEGFSMEVIDRDFLMKHGRDQEFWASSTKRFGFVLTKGGEEVSECSSVFVGGGMAEISIETKESYRRQGFATLVCSAFIEHCISIGIEPNWGCWDFREGSAELASKLGFVEVSRDVVFGVKGIQ